MYDAYVIYQMDCLDKATDNTLSQFTTKILPSVLEGKCGYRLFIHGRDDIPGQGQHPIVSFGVYFEPLSSVTHGVFYKF